MKKKQNKPKGATKKMTTVKEALDKEKTKEGLPREAFASSSRNSRAHKSGASV